MFRLSTVLALATAVVYVESFAPACVDQPLSEKLSEPRFSTVASRPDVKFPKRTSKSLRRQREVLQFERQLKRKSASKHVPPLPHRQEGPSIDPQSLREHITEDYPLDSATRTPGLTRQEEINYSFWIRTFRAAVRLRDQLVRDENGMHIHPSEEEWAQACGISVKELRRVMHDGQAARGALVAANVGLVTSIAKRYFSALKYSTQAGGGVGTILTLQDMIQEGNLGLMEAAERYEPEKGFRFSTYATWWVRQRIVRSISDYSRTIRLPAHVHSMLQKMKKAKAEIKSQLGREPTTPELAHHLDVPEEKLELYATSSRNVVSLELPLRTASFKEDRRTLGDTLASDAPTPEEDVEAEYLRRDIRAVMDTALADREREVIVKRFGLEDGKPRTVEETAELLGITRDRVRLVEARALNKLRHPQRNYKLKEYIGEGRISGGSSNSYKDHQVGVFSDRGNQEDKSERIWFF